MSNHIWFTIVLVAAFLLTVSASDSCGCDLPYKRIGCFKDTSADRALPQYILNERDRKSSVFSGTMIEWENWNSYMPGLICRCAAKAKELGYSYFGIQFFGECWSGPDMLASVNYDKHGKSNNCIGKGYAPCGEDERNCVGSGWTNAVFQIVDTKCDLKFERLGCYGDKPEPNRVFSDYIISDREKRVSVYSGQMIDWMNWETYLPEFVCRCAKKALSQGRNVFGMQYYGECWSSDDAEKTYYIQGERTNCVSNCYDQCFKYDPICIGKQWANAVYRIVTPNTCNVKYEPVGCFAEMSSERLMTRELVNQVDPNSQAFNGHMLFQTNWDEEFPDLLCRCAWKAAEKGFTGFVIHNKGECWSDPDFDQKFLLLGSSVNCVTNFNSTCSGSNCAGDISSHYVYKLSEGETNI